MVPRALSTNRIIISLIALDLALTSMAHTPKTIGAAVGVASEVIDDGDDDLVSLEEKKPENLDIVYT